MDKEAYIAQLKANIARVGYTFVGVFDPDGKDPNFAYSIGLTERGWPEVLLIGNINPAFIEILLTDLIEGWIKAGEVKLGDNPDLIAFADGSSHAMRVVEVDWEEAVTFYGCQVPFFYPDRDIKFVQALWPDKAGVFPDEEGYNVIMVQPIVGQ